MNSTLGTILDYLVFCLARARRGTVPKTDRVNLGSAYLTPAGWVNLDNSPSVFLSRHRFLRSLLEKAGLIEAAAQSRWRPDIVFHDVRHGLPWDTGTIRFIYSAHLLEHLTQRDGMNLLLECHRVLQSGGLLRIVVPDLRILALGYIDETANITDTSESSSRAAQRFLELVGMHAGEAVSTRNPHRWMYDAQSLGRTLAEAGFVDISVQPYRTGRFPELDVLDTRPDTSLHMECSKP
jgi:predicted SAM-dependent methyltransferase